MSALKCKQQVRAGRYFNWVKNTTQDDKMADFDEDGKFEADWSHGVCSSSYFNRLDKKPTRKCPRKLRYPAAKAYCEASGGRLCTLAELEKDYAKDSGCNLDWKTVWSATPCGPDKFWATTGSSKYTNKRPKRCHGIARAKNYMRCCSDGAKNACKPVWPWATCPKGSRSHDACQCVNGWAPKGGCKPPEPAVISCPKDQYVVGSPASCVKLEAYCRGGESKCWRWGTWKNPSYKGAYSWSEGICANSIYQGDGSAHFARFTKSGCSGQVNFAGSTTFCRDAGARLPTLDEAKDLVVRGTGCKYDRHRIWTSSKCGAGKVWVTSGKGRTKAQDPTWGQNTVCVSVKKKTAYTRCVGDVKGTSETAERCVKCPTGSSKAAGSGGLYDCKPKSGKKWDWARATVVSA
jgi:hypothetical protein